MQQCPVQPYCRSRQTPNYRPGTVTESSSDAVVPSIYVFVQCLVIIRRPCGTLPCHVMQCSADRISSGYPIDDIRVPTAEFDSLSEKMYPNEGSEVPLRKDGVYRAWSIHFWIFVRFPVSSPCGTTPLFLGREDGAFSVLLGSLLHYRDHSFLYTKIDGYFLFIFFYACVNQAIQLHYPQGAGRRQHIVADW